MALAGCQRPRRRRRSKGGARSVLPPAPRNLRLQTNPSAASLMEAGQQPGSIEAGRAAVPPALAATAAPPRQQVHCRRPLRQALTSTRAMPAAAAAAPLAASLNDAAHTTARGARALRWAARGAVPARKVAVEVCIAAAGGLGLLKRRAGRRAGLRGPGGRPCGAGGCSGARSGAAMGAGAPHGHAGQVGPRISPGWGRALPLGTPWPPSPGL